MNVVVHRIKFQGQELVFVQDPLWAMIGQITGAIATEEDFVRGRPSLAHLTIDGEIIRYGQRIGSIEEIDWDGPLEVDLEEETLGELVERGDFLH